MITTLNTIVFLLLPLFALSSQITILNLDEGERCKTSGLREWVCTKLEECFVDIEAEEPLIMCDGNGTSDMVCCPQSRRRVRQLPGKKANAYCENHQNLCNMTVNIEPVEDGIEFRNDVHPSIAGGRLSFPAEHPHMALIGYGETKEWLCGGTLISERFVISAAHCSSQPDLGAPKWARLGDLDYASDKDDENMQEMAIIEVIVHPNYKPPPLYNDIALFKLEKDVTFNFYVKPACLYTLLSIPYKFGTAAGWGRTSFVDDVSTQLRAVDLSIVNSTLCKALRKTSNKAPEGIKSQLMLCAGEPDGEKDTCQGDSGAPLVITIGKRCLKTQIGITSFGGVCAEPNSPGVYTRISNYVSWIESIVWP